MSKPETIADYIKSYPDTTQKALRAVYSTIKKAAPKADESISYGIPTFKIDGRPLIYFAGAKNHIGLHALPSGHEAFESDFSKYKRGKGSVQFPLDEPMPLTLITRVTKHRVKALKEEASTKSRSKR